MLGACGTRLLPALRPRLPQQCLPSDPAKLEGAITKGFGMFDKDKSGYVEGPEAVACARQVLKLAKITSVTDAQVRGSSRIRVVACRRASRQPPRPPAAACAACC